MQAFFEFVAGLITVLAAAALAHLGIDLEPRQGEEREIHRTNDCADEPHAMISASNQDC
jgi:hypothetical protein